MRSQCYYYFHFTDKENEACEDKNLPKKTEPVRPRVDI